MKTGLRHFTTLLYPAAWKTTAAVLENGYGMEIDAKSNDGYISIYAAANHGHLPIVDQLLKYCTDEIVRDKKGNNVLMTAIDIGHVDLVCWFMQNINPLNPELNPICYLLALLAHRFLHVSRIRVTSLTLRLLMSYIYIYIQGVPGGRDKTSGECSLC